MNKVLINLAVSFLIRQIQKFADQLDIAKVKLDLEARIRALIPGEFFDAEAVAFANMIVDMVYEFFKGDTDEQVIKLVVEGKSQEALQVALAYVKGKLGI